MELKSIFAVLTMLLAITGLASSCGGGGGSDSGVVTATLRFSNTCTSTTFDVYVNGTKGATLAPGQSISSTVNPGFYDVKACITNTTSCVSDRIGVSSRDDYTVYTCDI